MQYFVSPNIPHDPLLFPLPPCDCPPSVAGPWQFPIISQIVTELSSLGCTLEPLGHFFKSIGSSLRMVDRTGCPDRCTEETGTHEVPTLGNWTGLLRDPVSVNQWGGRICPSQGEEHSSQRQLRHLTGP